MVLTRVGCDQLFPSFRYMVAEIGARDLTDELQHVGGEKLMNDFGIVLLARVLIFSVSLLYYWRRADNFISHNKSGTTYFCQSALK